MSETPKAPDAWKMTRLGDILTDKQLKRCLKIMEKPDFHKPLSEYLESIEPKLETHKGVLPAYLAYMFEFMRMQGKL